MSDAPRNRSPLIVIMMMRKFIFLLFSGMALVVATGRKIWAVYIMPHEVDALLEHGHIQGATSSEKVIYHSHQSNILAYRSID